MSQLLALSLSLFLVPAICQSDEPGGNHCDRSLPRDSTPAPSFEGPEWKLVDRGEMTFRYSFYRRADAARVTAMTVEGERDGGITTRRSSWQVGDEIYARRDGPEGEGEPVCVRSIRRSGEPPEAGGFDLHRLYLSIKDRLQRNPPAEKLP